MSVQTETRVRRVTWTPWSPAQVLVAALGSFLIILAVLVVVRGGIGDWTSPRTAVWGFRHTPLMAAIEFGLGLLILSAAANALAAKTTLMGIGVFMAVFGIITLIEPAAFSRLLGVNRQMGLLYTGVGVGGFFLGAASPVFR